MSNGIEPIFGAQYERSVRSASNDILKFTVQDYALRLWQEKNNSTLPPNWVVSHDLQPEDHLQMQAAVQPFIDNAISKTINIPADFPFEKLLKVYTQAYELGLKGCTIFRPNPVTGSVLQLTEEDSDRCCRVD